MMTFAKFLKAARELVSDSSRSVCVEVNAWSWGSGTTDVEWKCYLAARGAESGISGSGPTPNDALVAFRKALNGETPQDRTVCPPDAVVIGDVEASQ